MVGTFNGLDVPSRNATATIGSGDVNFGIIVDQSARAIYPPTPAASGTVWREPILGHSATLDGTTWRALEPADSELNICCVLASFVGLWDVEGSAAALNQGAGGATLDGTVTGATATTDLDGYAVWSFDGVDDLISIADNDALLDFAAADEFTLVAIAAGTWSTVNKTIIGKRNAPANASVNAGYTIATGASVAATVAGRIADGAVVIDAATYAAAVDTAQHGFVLARSGDLVTPYLDGITGTSVTDTTTGSLDTTQSLRIAGFGTSRTAMSGYAFALARRALTETEIRLLELWRQTRWP